MKATLYTTTGKTSKEIVLPKVLFEVTVKPQLFAQAIRVIEDRLHRGANKAQTRGEVNRTTAKVYAQKHTGFTANEEGRSEGTYSKYASLDDKTDGFHFYLAFIKFGIGRATSDAAHEIRDGHITREEGAALVRRYDGEFPQKYFKDFLDYLDIDEKHFWEVVDSWRPPHLWEKVNGEWKLKHQVS